VHFCGPTGANAVEAAIKLCKTHTGRADVVAFQGAFHGSTHASMAVSGMLEPKENVAGLMPGVHFFPYSYCLRCPLSLSPDSCATNCARYLENSFDDRHGGIPRPAAIILELVQGEGGVVPATQEFARMVGRIAKKLDVPLIVDEIQTGYGRTGTWFAFERYDIEPDIVLASKALGGIGLPIAVMFYDRRLDTWGPGAHIGTYRGHQLAFAASVEALRVMRRDDILANVVAQGDYLLDRLVELRDRHSCVAQVRGVGLMLGLEIVELDTGRPDGDRAARIHRAALRRGLILELGGREDAVVRLLPPLNISRRTAEIAFAILAEAFDDVCGDPQRAPVCAGERA